MGKTFFGTELGSTRIKSVLIGEGGEVLSSGAHTWENKLENGLWTYSEQDIWRGVRDGFADLAREHKSKFGEPPQISGMGFSGMMHGYIALDRDGNLLAPFRTWRNTNTAKAADRLTKLLNFNIPMRWSIAHLYQAILDDEPHVKDIAYLTTLAGYVHYKLTGEKVLGVGEASGMFPIDSDACDYDAAMLGKVDALIAEKNYPWKLRGILPKVLKAGESAGKLTESGAKLLDPSGNLTSGIPLCPPEGDAGTGMVATNSVNKKTGNVSAGTSVFAMVVLDKPLKNLHTEIDMVTTPDGAPVAMVHCNNCTSDINAWAGMLGEFAAAIGKPTNSGELMTLLFGESLKGDADCGKTVSYNYFSGEPVTGLSTGKPLLLREPDGKLTLANFMKSLIYSSVASLAIGMEILAGEGAEITEMCGHGGFFKTPCVGQRVMSAAVNAPVTVMQNAGEGGAWGIALLAAYAARRGEKSVPLGEYLRGIFADSNKITLAATDDDKKDFAAYLARYKKYLCAEHTAAEVE